jgi:hypothetical protein
MMMKMTRKEEYFETQKKEKNKRRKKKRTVSHSFIKLNKGSATFFFFPKIFKQDKEKKSRYMMRIIATKRKNTSGLLLMNMIDQR